MSTDPDKAKGMPQIRYESVEAWKAEGRRRFGPDVFKWRHVCPACGHVQKVEDFRPFKDRGATADTARSNCIGRYLPTARKAFGGGGTGPCDYTAYGLFNICPVTVVSDGCEVPAFAFDEPDPDPDPEMVTLYSVYNRRLFSCQATRDDETATYRPLTDSSAFGCGNPIPALECVATMLTPESAHAAAIAGEQRQRDKLAQELTDYCTEQGFPLDSPFYRLWQQALEATVQLRMLEFIKPTLLDNIKQLPVITTKIDEP